MATMRRMVAWFDRRRSVIAILLAFWAVIIGLGAGPAPSSTSWLGVPSMQRVFAAIAVLWLLVGLVLFVAMVLFRRRGPSERRARRSIWPTMVLLLVFFALASRLSGPEDDEVVSEGPPVAAEDDGTGSRRSPVIEGGELGVLVLVLGLAVSVVFWSRRRLSSHIEGLSEAAQLTLEAALEPVIGQAADDLDVGTDARSAVMVAYAGLEHALADLGHARDPAETPTEYLRRVLSHLPVDAGPLIHLAGLYEVARFSDHALSSQDQRDAARSLHRIRRGLVTVARR